ncbi:DUF2268 domain-containing putative Zn-dependent protease [Nanoarchaeota archaeon]
MEENNKGLFELHNFLDIESSPEKTMEKIVENIHELEDIGFAGCLEKEWLKTTLRRFMVDKEGNDQHYSYSVEHGKEARRICEEVIKKCKGYINEKIHIFLFPTFDQFVIEEMEGVGGFSTWDNTILVFINFKDNWKVSLKETIVHELAHALSPFYKGGDFSIGYGLVLDGIAEHFKDFILPERRSPWTQAISEENAWKIFLEIKDILELKNFDKYNELFYGTGKYPMWAGYTIGFYIVKDYLKKQKDVDWNELLRKDPKEILKEIS